MVTSLAGAATAYAWLRDASGDEWSVVDWSRFYRYEHTEASSARRGRSVERLQQRPCALQREAARFLHQEQGTNDTIAAIAWDAGFAHQSHLTRTFRRLMRTTPAKYRASFRRD